MSINLEKEWTSKNGHLCQVISNNRGFRCGYVFIDKNNSLHGKDYDSSLSDENEESIVSYFSVHGGITFASNGDEFSHNAKNKKLWCFGFDCAHCYDAYDPELLKDRNPYYSGLQSRESGSIIRTLQFCIEECESLSEQLKEFDNEAPSNI